MDAHVFRRFCTVLTDVLHNARLEKIQSPAVDVHIFTFYAQQRKQILVLRHDRRNPLLFLSPERYSTGQAPPASTMRLRKYAAGRRIKNLRVDWPARRLHMCFQLPALPSELTQTVLGPIKIFDNTDSDKALYIPQPETWISLDLRQGPLLTLGSSPDFGAEPLWPSTDDIRACLKPSACPVPTDDIRACLKPSACPVPTDDVRACLTPSACVTLHEHVPNATPVSGRSVEISPLVEKAEQEESSANADPMPVAQAWEQWPVLTPALRRTLVHLDAPEQAALLADLEYGGGDIFVYSAAQNGTSAPPDFVAWPLPATLRGTRHEQVYEDPVEALASAGAQAVLGGIERAGQQSAASPHKREAKRLTKVLEKLEREEARLRAMVAGKDRALYIQSVLWYFSPEARPADLAQSPACVAPSATGATAHAALCAAEHDSGHETPEEGPLLPPCPFDPALLQARLSLRENMEALFHGAARGHRGLAMLEQRRALLRGQVTVAEDAAQGVSLLPANFAGLPLDPTRSGNTGATAQGKAQRQSAQQGKAGKQSSALTPTVGQRILPKNVEAFTSVDGLIILRGKDAKGNLALLKLGAPSDVWLHVEGGPGAHTLVRRATVGQEIPQTTLEQAATLAAVKSWQKGNERVGVQCAEVRHVKPMRGAAMGTVRIDKVACMVWVTMPLMSA